MDSEIGNGIKQHSAKSQQHSQPQSAGETVESLKAKLAAAEAKNAELMAERNGEGAGIGSFPRSDRTTTTKPTYMFDVWTTNPKANLPKQQILAIDESEAIRLYAVRNLNEGKPLDTVKNPVKAKCLEDAKRRTASRVAHENRLVESGYQSPASPPSELLSAVSPAAANLGI